MAFPGWREKRSGVSILPRGVSVRRGTADDEYATFGVMGQAAGYQMNWSNHASARRHLRTSPHASYWVAEDTPRFGSAKIVGYIRSVVREDVWNLTEFFVLPDYQRKGIGGELIARCLEDGAKAGARRRFVLASVQAAADSLYMRKAGCFPRIPMVLLAGPTDVLRSGNEGYAPILESLRMDPARSFADAGEGTLIAEPLILTAEVREALCDLDRTIVGYARLPEHEHWTAEMGGSGGASRLFRRDAQIVGYTYVGTSASGPALALAADDLPRMISHVTNIARPASRAIGPLDRPPVAEQYWAVPGVNEVMLRWLLDCGWQIVFQYLFMSSCPLGSLDRYVCHNPLYVL